MYHVLESHQPEKRVPPVIFRENDEGAISLSQKALSSGGTKHIDVRHHYIRNFVKRDKVKIDHVSSEGRHADTLTKHLSIGSSEPNRDFLLSSRRKGEGGYHNLNRR